ncbi:MAG: Mth938-like domain-containing protein [Pseudomonadota bacterium]
MKFTLEQTGGTYSLHSYSDGTIIIRPPNAAPEDDEGLLRLEKSCLLSPEHLIDDWPPQQMAELTTEHLQALKGLKAEVLLLGSGKAMRFPSTEQLAALVRLGIGYEVMDTAAACRTYNVLVSEGRKVAAALFP